MASVPRLLVLALVPFLSSAALAQTADLRLAPQIQDLSDRFVVGFALVNLGPDVARKTVLTFDVPESVTVQRIIYGAGNDLKTCDASSRPIRCEVGDLHVMQPFHYGEIAIMKGIENARHTMSLSVSSETPDPQPANNSHTASWATSIEADLGVYVFTNSDRVDPAGEASFVANVCNNTRDNQPPSVRAEFSAANGFITAIEPATGFTCHLEAEGARAVCTLPRLVECPSEPFRIAANAASDRLGGELNLSARVSSDVLEVNPSDNEANSVVAVYRWIAVTTTADEGPGSLRQAIDEANASCSPGPCRIVFEIPAPVPAEGWFTITPSSPLPAIVADRVTLEGNRQTVFTGNTNARGPEVAIDGRFAHSGLKMLARCEGVVDGLALGNFDDQGLWISTAGCTNRPDRREVLDNHVGIDPAGTEPWPNRVGLRADFAERLTVARNVIAHNRRSGMWMWRGSAMIHQNFIDQNGASGLYFGPEVSWASVSSNVIRNQREMGIALNRNAGYVLMRGNSMRANGGLGIDWGLDGVSPTDADDQHQRSNAPVLLAAVYDATAPATRITLTLRSAPLGPYINQGSLEFFTNDGPDGDGEWFIGAHSGRMTGDTTTVSIPGDFRGKWINATWTREHWYGARGPGEPKTNSHLGPYGAVTSELSNTVPVR